MEARIVVRADDGMLAAFVDDFYDDLERHGYRGERLAPDDFVLERIREAADDEFRAAFPFAGAMGLTIEVEERVL